MIFHGWRQCFELLTNGQAIMFYSCDLLINFFVSNLRGQTTLPCLTFARMSECGVILERRSEGAYLYPLHFEGQKSANFAPQFDDGAT